MIKKIMLLLVVMVVVQGLVMGAEREQQPSFTEGVAPDDDQKEKTLIDLADRFLFDINYKAPLERFVQHSSSDVIPFLQRLNQASEKITAEINGLCLKMMEDQHLKKRCEILQALIIAKANQDSAFFNDFKLRKNIIHVLIGAGGLGDYDYLRCVNSRNVYFLDPTNNDISYEEWFNFVSNPPLKPTPASTPHRGRERVLRGVDSLHSGGLGGRQSELRQGKTVGQVREEKITLLKEYLASQHPSEGFTVEELAGFVDGAFAEYKTHRRLPSYAVELFGQFDFNGISPKDLSSVVQSYKAYRTSSGRPQGSTPGASASPSAALSLYSDDAAGGATASASSSNEPSLYPDLAAGGTAAAAAATLTGFLVNATITNLAKKRALMLLEGKDTAAIDARLKKLRSSRFFKIGGAAVGAGLLAGGATAFARRRRRK